MNKLYIDNKIIYEMNDEKISKYQMKMINNNDNIVSVKLLEEKILQFDISGLISIKDFELKYYNIDKEKLIDKIEHIVTEAKKSLLNENNFEIDIENILINEKDFLQTMNYNLLKFIYIPIETDVYDYDKSLNEIKTGNVISYKNIYKKQAINNKSELLEKLLKQEEENIIDSKDNKIVNKYKKILIFMLFIFAFALFKYNVFLTYILILSFFLFCVLKRLIYRINIIDESENDEMETLVLERKPYLQRHFFEDRIYINKDEFTIGKSDSNDMIINSNSISKYHSKIIKNNGAYYIMDLQSTNHTFVNNEFIDGCEKRLLLNGDKIKFANFVYTFYSNK